MIGLEPILGGMSYTLNRRVDEPFEAVVSTTIDALEDEGFGVLCDIDAQATFEEKLGEEFRQYRILGACNPGLARQGLEADLDLGALLPCNVVVYETDGGEVAVSAVDPRRVLGLAENGDLDSIGDDAHERFERALENV